MKTDLGRTLHVRKNIVPYRLSARSLSQSPTPEQSERDVFRMNISPKHSKPASHCRKKNHAPAMDLERRQRFDRQTRAKKNYVNHIREKTEDQCLDHTIKFRLFSLRTQGPRYTRTHKPGKQDKECNECL